MYKYEHIKPYTLPSRSKSQPHNPKLVQEHVLPVKMCMAEGLHLFGENKDANLFKDPAMLKKLQDIDNLSEDDKSGVIIDASGLVKNECLNTTK